MSNFWSIFITVVTLGNILGYTFLLYRMRKMPKDDVASGEKRDHTFDGIEEYNNPLPRWWMWLFYLCNIFALVYLVLYPGLGNYKGSLGWSQQKQWEQQKEEANALYAHIFENYAKQPIPDLIQDNQAMQVGKRLFINTCSACHGVNAQGARGFPNLTTRNWLYGGDPDTLKQTIMEGRNGFMPPLGPAVGGEEGIKAVANYVRKISGQSFDEKYANKGEAHFKGLCAACHGPEGKGNPALGAPNLTTGEFIVGGSLEDIESIIRNGRQAQMPAHKDILGPDKVHLVAAYVYYLSHKDDKKKNAE